MPNNAPVRPRRRTVALLMVCGLLAGCSATVVGQATPADNNGPVPVKDSALKKALLDDGDLDDIMGATGMTEQRTSDELSPDDTDFDGSCLGPWLPIQQSVYEDSGYSAVYLSVSYEEGEHYEHTVWQAAVSFESRADASAFLEEASQAWTSCGDREFSGRTSSGDGYDWEFSAAVTEGSTVSLTQTQLTSRSGWGCHRALRATNNVVLDVMACLQKPDDQATTIVDEIDAKLPSI